MRPRPRVRIAHVRPFRHAHRRHHVPSGVGRTDAARDGPRRALLRMALAAAGRPDGARGELLSARAGRERHAMSADDDVCERARAAPARPARSRDVALTHLRRPLRSAFASRCAETVGTPRHGHDRAAGRLRRSRQPHAGGARRRWRMAHHRSQVVFLRTAVRRASRPRAGRRGPLVLPDAAHRARRQAQQHPHQPAEGQAWQPQQCVGRGRVRRCARVARRRAGPRNRDDPGDGAAHAPRLHCCKRRNDPRRADRGAASRAVPRDVRPRARPASADGKRAGRPRARKRGVVATRDDARTRRRIRRERGRRSSSIARCPDVSRIRSRRDRCRSSSRLPALRARDAASARAALPARRGAPSC